MKSKDILKMLDSEVSHLTKDEPSHNITATPISVSHERTAVPKPVPKRAFVHTKAFRAMCACLVCVAVLTGIVVPVVLVNGGGGAIPVVGPTYVTMDINPSVDYVVSKDDTVANVISRNNDGDILLSNGFRESIIGKDIDEAVSMTLAQATKLGFVKADSKGNAVRFKVAGDSDKKANEVLASIKNSAMTHLKSNGIYMVVVGKMVDKDSLIGGTALKSIEELNNEIKDSDSYHYINTAKNKTKDELIESFKTDFAMDYIEDAFDELVEDIDDMFDIVREIDELEAELSEVERESGVINPVGYWHYKLIPTDNEDINEVVDEITKHIDEFNSKLTAEEDNEDEDNFIDISKVFDKIEGAVSLKEVKGYRLVYESAGIRTKLEKVFAKVKDKVLTVDAMLDEISNIFTIKVGKISAAIDEVKAHIKGMLDEISETADKYYNICKDRIDSAYATLVKRNEANKGGTAITDEDYEEFLKEALDGYDDIDDYWEKTHR